jgi:hypothetical protein
VRLTAAHLTDGPWCPNAADRHRFDADLLRVRTVRVTLRVQTGNETLRRAFVRSEPYDEDQLFMNPGTSAGGYREVPDQAIRFDVTPRNLNLDR